MAPKYIWVATSRQALHVTMLATKQFQHCQLNSPTMAKLCGHLFIGHVEHQTDILIPSVFSSGKPRDHVREQQRVWTALVALALLWAWWPNFVESFFGQPENWDEKSFSLFKRWLKQGPAWISAKIMLCLLTSPCQPVRDGGIGVIQPEIIFCAWKKETFSTNWRKTEIKKQKTWDQEKIKQIKNLGVPGRSRSCRWFPPAWSLSLLQENRREACGGK